MAAPSPAAGAGLDVQYDAHGPRPADAVRTVDPAQPVQRAQWQNGELDVWIRDNGEWLGRVRDKNGRAIWFPGTDCAREKMSRA